MPDLVSIFSFLVVNDQCNNLKQQMRNVSAHFNVFQSVIALENLTNHVLKPIIEECITSFQSFCFYLWATNATTNEECLNSFQCLVIQIWSKVFPRTPPQDPSKGVLTASGLTMPSLCIDYMKSVLWLRRGHFQKAPISGLKKHFWGMSQLISMFLL